MTFYFTVNYSVMSLLLRMWIVFWPRDDCYSPGSVFAQLYLCCLKLPWIARRSNQSILKEIGPEISLEGMMLKLKLQYLAASCEELTHWKRL